MTTKILNQSQAEAVYTAMCALNNVYGVVDVSFPLTPGKSGFATVRENVVGAVHVIVEMETVERYVSQAAFATAYGLQQG